MKDQWRLEKHALHRPVTKAFVYGILWHLFLGNQYSFGLGSGFRTHHAYIMSHDHFEFQVLSPNIEMANCGIHFGLRHQNEASHTKGSRGHSPAFHLFNFLSLACNLLYTLVGLETFVRSIRLSILHLKRGILQSTWRNVRLDVPEEDSWFFALYLKPV